jgi:hypothetical protein
MRGRFDSGSAGGRASWLCVPSSAACRPKPGADSRCRSPLCLFERRARARSRTSPHEPASCRAVQSGGICNGQPHRRSTASRALRKASSSTAPPARWRTAGPGSVGGAGARPSTRVRRQFPRDGGTPKRFGPAPSAPRRGGIFPREDPQGEQERPARLERHSGDLHVPRARPRPPHRAIVAPRPDELDAHRSEVASLSAWKPPVPSE